MHLRLIKGCPMMALCAPLWRILTSLWTTPRNIPHCWKAVIRGSP